MKGYCECGCGGKTNLAVASVPKIGHVKGEPLRYIRGHNTRKSSMEYIVNTQTGCWEWQRGKNERGYGVIRVGGRTKKAHRCYYEKYVGEIPGGMTIDHLCRNRACVNPDHLEPVTQTENVRRGRAAKLKNRDVLEIRWLRQLGLTCRVIGDIFGVSEKQIGMISNNKSWRTT